MLKKSFSESYKQSPQTKLGSQQIHVPQGAKKHKVQIWLLA